MNTLLLAPEKAFPLQVIRYRTGWAIMLMQPDGEQRHLLRPGWETETRSPYVFQTPQEAWNFLKQLFMFCLKQQHTLYLGTDKVMNCERCGRVFRARFYGYCPGCMQENRDMLQQIWQGIYFQTGSQDHALERISALLRIPKSQLKEAQAAYLEYFRKNMVETSSSSRNDRWAALLPEPSRSASIPKTSKKPTIRRKQELDVEEKRLGTPQSSSIDENPARFIQYGFKQGHS